MNIFRKYKTFPLILLLILLLSSCSNSAQRNLASTDIIKNAENEIVEGEYRYIVNKRTGKIHTYHHSMNSGMNPDNMLMTNDNLEMILEDEGKDLCRNCWAGIKTNLKSYDDNALDLIEKFMRLYDFAELDIETQKFLMCIFEVGEWYVDNVYTYQGGKQTVLETETIAKASASESAYKRWRNYLDNEYYNKYKLRNEKKVLPVVYDSDNKPTTLVIYRCDLFKKLNYGYGNNKYSKSGKQALKNAEGEIIDEEWKNYCVIDDCSKFAAAVYYHYINKEILKNKSTEEKIGYGIDLWGTGSLAFASDNSDLIKILSYKCQSFELYDLNRINKYKDFNNINNDINTFKLQAGDLLYRQADYKNNLEGHVEFYIGNSKVIGWGRVHDSYTINKTFTLHDQGFFSNDVLDNNQPYTALIRLKGVK